MCIIIKSDWTTTCNWIDWLIASADRVFQLFYFCTKWQKQLTYSKPETLEKTPSWAAKHLLIMHLCVCFPFLYVFSCGIVKWVVKYLAAPSVSLDGDGPASAVECPGMGEETGCQCSSCGVPCCLLSGTCSLRDKTEAIQLFPDMGGVKLMVLGMGAHSSGLGRSRPHFPIAHTC